MNIRLKRKYLGGQDPEKQKGIAWRGRKAGGASGGHSGNARSKGSRHPIGMSGRTLSMMTRAYREHK